MKNTVSPRHIYFDKPYYIRQDRFSSTDRYRRELDILSDSIGAVKGDVVLDIGCNTGTAADYISRKCGCKVIGMDFPEEWLGVCRLRDCLRGDAHYLPFKSSIFDKVYMLHVLCHVMFPEVILSEVARVLKRGGVFCMINPNKYFVYSMRPLNYSGIIKYNPDRTVLRYYSKAETDKMILRSGMSVLKSQEFGDMPPYLKRCGDRGIFRSLRERILTLAMKRAV